MSRPGQLEPLALGSTDLGQHCGGLQYSGGGRAGVAMRVAVVFLSSEASVVYHPLRHSK